MLNIAIIGNDCEQSTKNTLYGLLELMERRVFSYDKTKCLTFNQLAENRADVFIAPMNTYLLEQKKDAVDILIFESGTSIDSSAALNFANEKAVIIISADDTELYKYLLGSKANVLTYGFNGKASVTASSILENMDKKYVQICIQRSFKTSNGRIIDIQEIPVTCSIKSDSQILNEIAAITAALYLGINPKTISLCSFS